jgi:RimJ/RimL family protein N-acetyltransferase
MLRNERFFLRPTGPGDIPARHEWFNDPEFTRLYLGRPTLIPYRQVEDEVLYATSPMISSGLFELAIQMTDGNLYIGNTYFRKIDWQNHSAEYGIFIGSKEKWGMNIGKDATLMMLEYGFTELGFHRIWLTVFSYNHRAIKCFEKCGITKEGVLRGAVFSGGQFNDVIMMSILKGAE